MIMLMVAISKACFFCGGDDGDINADDDDHLVNGDDGGVDHVDDVVQPLFQQLSSSSAACPVQSPPARHSGGNY